MNNLPLDKGGFVWYIKVLNRNININGRKDWIRICKICPKAQSPSEVTTVQCGGSPPEQLPDFESVVLRG